MVRHAVVCLALCACGGGTVGGDVDAATGPQLHVPAVIPIPYVEAGAGASQLDVAVSNPGTAPARQVELLAQLPPGLKFVSANNAGRYEDTTRTVRWLLEELRVQVFAQELRTPVPVSAKRLQKMWQSMQR